MMPQGPSTMLGQLQQRLSADRIVTDPTQLEAVSIDPRFTPHRRRGERLAYPV